MNRKGLQSKIEKLGADMLKLENKYPNDAEFGRMARQRVKQLKFRNAKNLYVGPTKL
tara:strand:+ start:257 stop:427 length:171 start_codon:yes stop_codon:yes gene_type:complete